MGFFRLAVVLMALSACTAQTSRPSASQLGAPPFQAVAPASYCLSDESDPLALAFMIGMTRNAAPDQRVLAVFRPCSEPALQKGVRTWNSIRLIYQIEAGPTAGPGRPPMDRETYLTFLANPKLTELWNRRNLPKLEGNPPPKSGGARYLGSDSEAVYTSIVFTPHSTPPGVAAEARVVLGQTLIGKTALRLHVVNLSANSTPADWSHLQTIAAQAIHATIATAERPASGVPAPASPSPHPPGAGLTT
ncbi:hypothetical protein [Inquilinus limosus]|uniref:Uncharacterized protein n=1 Tax=Inquilinus limosus MP06 TaxID=1398085 RepID=A0A0A0DA92_9PROT|nr:hypothetical protein [Inquilinus limosus]KGM35054.1 hypothetical protein P409_06655 [Inquilinus limosus MP06]